MNKLILGRYFPGNSLIHQLDPRAKLCLAIYFIALLFFVNSIVGYLLMIGFVFCVIKLTGVSVRIYLRGIRPLIWLILMAVFFRVIFTAGGTIFVSKGPIAISSYGLLLGFYTFNRFVLIILISTVLTLTTKPVDLTDAIDALLKPLRLIGISTSEFSLMLSISLRFIPNLLDETQKVLDAQRARGVEFGEGRLTEQMKKIVPLIIPLFSSSLKRAEEMADVLEVRGYQPGQKRSSFRRLSWQMRDTISLVLMGCLTIGVVVLNQLTLFERWIY
ncbi:energy-coupling factor transporter transmembrane component T family protein [Amphibacillus xylanus]|uniref:Putative ABC transporter permease protein n=1 Tax=Amphibacillus xylanus (strain ATCC 51415 / DSM 6626 / JCM 7361 / LMG 17667 / NBRC 15112 / Ep01) TaxID=698758 RepID=K0J5L6_AMPXN|nr:putative ABC transporter permease protein [Amphibacillus xylanus NBRC 15112]